MVYGLLCMVYGVCCMVNVYGVWCMVFKVEMKQLDIDIYAISVDDRKDARKLASVNMWPQIILSVIFIGGYFFILYMLFSSTIKIDDSIRDMSNILLGVLTASIPSIMSFWFGSSHGSHKKDEKKNPD